jgi:hypothetical protein
MEKRFGSGRSLTLVDMSEVASLRGCWTRGESGSREKRESKGGENETGSAVVGGSEFGPGSW